jgi:hypothetical protein
MEFTGQAAIDFKKWFLEVKCKDIKRKIPKKLKYQVLLSSDESMQFGVRQDWLDSVGIYSGTEKNNLGTFNNWAGHPLIGAMPSTKTRPEARLAVILKADELYNAQTPSTT